MTLPLTSQLPRLYARGWTCACRGSCSAQQAARTRATTARAPRTPCWQWRALVAHWSCTRFRGTRVCGRRTGCRRGRGSWRLLGRVSAPRLQVGRGRRRRPYNFPTRSQEYLHPLTLRAPTPPPPFSILHPLSRVLTPADANGLSGSKGVGLKVTYLITTLGHPGRDTPEQETPNPPEPSTINPHP